MPMAAGTRVAVCRAIATLVIGAGIAALYGAPSTLAQGGEAALVRRARAVHDRVITLDTHVDFNPASFQWSRNYTIDLGTQVSLPAMAAGGLDAAFLIVYVGQDTGPDAFETAGFDRAYALALEKFEAIHRLTRLLAPDRIGLALTPADVPRIARSGRKVAVIGIENGYPIGRNLGRVREFWERGGRYMSLAHNGHSQLSDSNTGEASGQWAHGDGLSDLGRQVIGEMNRWGIMVDVSHPSRGSMMQTASMSKAPIIASHSAARALCNHSRNMDDEQLQAVRKSGGVVQVVAFAGYVKCDPAPPGRTQAIAALRQEFGLPPAAGRGGGGGRGGGRGGRGATAPAPQGTTATAAGSAAALPATGRTGGRGAAPDAAVQALAPDRRREYDARLADIDEQYPAAPRATVKDFVDHIDYIVKLIGIDHVGIASDFDGGGGVDGWDTAAETFNVTLELVRRGYTEAQIARIWSGNLLRVWSDVERVAKELREDRR